MKSCALCSICSVVILKLEMFQWLPSLFIKINPGMNTGVLKVFELGINPIHDCIDSIYK